MKNKLKIKEPIWISKSIGIAAKRAFADLEIEIMYKDQYHNRVYPATYSIRAEKIITYPYRYIGGNRIYIVPIKDLTINKERSKCLMCGKEVGNKKHNLCKDCLISNSENLEE